MSEHVLVCCRLAGSVRWGVFLTVFSCSLLGENLTQMLMSRGKKDMLSHYPPSSSVPCVSSRVHTRRSLTDLTS